MASLCGTMEFMKHPFKISLSRLEKEGICTFEERVDGDFLEVVERELAYPDPIDVWGSLTLAGSALLITFSLRAKAQSPCIICGKSVKIGVDLNDVCHAEPLDDIRGEVFDYSHIIRDVILIETEPYGECGGNCPEREHLDQYFKKDTGAQSPFKDLKFEAE